MNLIQCYQKNSTWYRGARKNGKPVGVLWHDTAGGNPNICRYVQPFETDSNYKEMISLLGKNKYSNDWNHIEHEAGVNAWIGKIGNGSIATVQVGDLDIHAWGCGGGTKGSCNGYIKTSDGKTQWVDDFWIQFEICDDGYNDKEYFAKVYKEACEFTAYICMKYGIDPNGTVEFNGVKVPTILCHQDSYKLKLGCDHGDVYKWFNKFGKTMDNVREDVAKIIKASNIPAVTASSATNYTSFKKGVVVSIKSGATYYNGASIPAWVLGKNWIVYQDATSSRVLIDKSEDGKNSIMSPIDAKHLTIVTQNDTNKTAESKEPAVSIHKTDDNPQDVKPSKPTEETEPEGTYINSPEEAQSFFIKLLNNAIDFIIKLFKK